MYDNENWLSDYDKAWIEDYINLMIPRFMLVPTAEKVKKLEEQREGLRKNLIAFLKYIHFEGKINN